MYEKEFEVIKSLNNIKKYCEANYNHWKCRTCIFYNTRKYNCPRNGQFFIDFHTWIQTTYNLDPFSISDTEYCFMLKQYFYTYISK